MKNFNDLMAEAKKCPARRVVVAVAHDGEVLEGVNAAYQVGIANALLIGNREEIIRIAEARKIDLAPHKIINETDSKAACIMAVKAIRENNADILMKGQVPSPLVLKAVLDKNNGLRDGKVLSHIAVFEAPGYERLFLLSDSGLNIAPTFKQKIGMINNAVELAGNLNIKQPKVAIIAGIEFVNQNMLSSIDAALLAKMSERGQIKNCIIDGPLSLDLAISEAAAHAKGVGGQVSGKADILIMPNIDAANVLYKAVSFMLNSKITGIIAGAKAPVILTSRADSYEAKLYSIALGVLMTKNNIIPLQRVVRVLKGEEKASDYENRTG